MPDLSLYDKLSSTANEFVLSTSPKTAGTNEPDGERFRSRLAADFRMSWGHKYMVSTKPFLQGSVDGDGFLKHQAGMASSLETWSIEPTSVCVDVEQRTVVVRADFFMTAKNQEPVLNDIIFWIVLDEAGEKVVKAMEFVDGDASAELARRMKAGPSA